MMGDNQTAVAYTVNQQGDNQTAVVYGVCSYDSNAMKSDNPNSGFYEAETSRTLDNNGGNPACNQGGMMIVQDDVQYRVRRLTPLECERLQGFPDGWTDIGEEREIEVKDYEYQTETRELPDGGYEDVERKVCVGSHVEKARFWTDSNGALRKNADSHRYRALGNSIALPYWKWMLRNMAEYLPEGATLGSLFDGISGFCLIWAEQFGYDTPRWSSEIEEFCVAVATTHFGDEDKGIEGDLKGVIK